MTRQEIIDEYHRIYYDEEHRSPIINNTRWHGIVIQKCPLDLWSYQEIMFEVKPRLIIETGTLHGGSAQWFAHMLGLIHGDSVPWQVCSVDIRNQVRGALQGNIFLFVGSSVDPLVLNPIKAFVEHLSPVMVVLDSDHRAEHVYKELDIYSQFVTPGSYLIVEDTDCNGHPILPRHGPGPWEAVHDWLPKHPEFEIDKSREKFLLTMNPDGYLRRKI